MAFSRISARRGSPVDLPAILVQGGLAQDPFAIYRIELYKGKVAVENLVGVVSIDSPDSTSYPLPLMRDNVGVYRYTWDVPEDVGVPDIYFDVWYFFASDPRVGTDDILDNHLDRLITVCNRFWVYPESWYVDGGLSTIRFDFEPLDLKFHKPEKRPLEVGLMPLPLYDYDYNLVAPIIPYLDAKITIKTENDEIVVDSALMQIKLRQGSYRTNPFVLSYMLDTSTLFIGTYKYRIIVIMPDGSTRVSGNYYLTVS